MLSELVTYRPGDHDLSGWRVLADRLRKTVAEVRGANVACFAIQTRLQTKNALGESTRWGSLESLYHQYLTLLAPYGQDQFEAQIKAAQAEALRADRDIVLVALFDLPTVTRDLIRATSANVHCLIHALEIHSNGFDAVGNLISEYWSTAHIPIHSDSLLIADSAQDQAYIVAEEVKEALQTNGPADITVGVCSTDLTGLIERTLEMSGIAARPAATRSIGSLGPAVLLSAFADFVLDDRMANLEVLLRHPDFLTFLQNHTAIGIEANRLPALLDDYTATHLPPALRSGMVPEGEKGAPLLSVLHAIESLLTDIRAMPRSLGAWSRPITRLIANIYSGREFDMANVKDAADVECLKALVATLAEMEKISLTGPLAVTADAAETIRFLVTYISDTIVGDTEDTAIELLGWLELLNDDAPVLIVSGMNDGAVPTSVNSDALLSDTLRSEFGLVDNARRYARDAYVLAAMAASKTRLRLVASRIDIDGNPLKPSRLLFADTDEIAAKRALCFYDGEKRPPAKSVSLCYGRSDRLSDLPLPEPAQAVPSRISVTGLRDYLACPYRFYLRHVLRLTSVDGELPEMDARHVGTLIHGVLNDFAASEVNGLKDAVAIEVYLFSRLDARASAMFGTDLLPMVQIQMVQLRRRLAAFSRFQAEHSAKGWDIVAHEEKGITTFALREGEVIVDGRIDRIDRHRESGHHLILDYKISDSRPDPENRHRKNKGEWIDLQLPLYRRMAAGFGVDSNVQVGYIGRGRRENDIVLSLADWSEDDFAGAYSCATSALQSIRDRVFWPPSTDTPRYADGLEAICRDRLPERNQRIEALLRTLATGGGD
jgi:hypothetical protein